jgi:galactose mutarotase-like enzyme
VPDLVELTAPGMSLSLDLAAGGRATSWLIDGCEVLGASSCQPVENGMYPMAPWAGRVRDNTLRHGGGAYPLPPSHGEWALHGTVLAAPSQMLSWISRDEGAEATTVTGLGPDWPWAGRLTSTWRVNADGVTTVLTLETEGEAFPGVVGWHPWFKRRLGDGPAAHWHLPDPRLAERVEGFRLSGRLTPVDLSSRTFDDAFLVEARAASIEWPGQLRIDLSSSHPWFVVFDELPDFICIEPQSGPPNGINDGLVAPVTLVAPGQPLELVNEWRVTRGRLGG